MADVHKDALAHLETDQVKLASRHGILVVQNADEVALCKLALIEADQLAAIEAAGHGEAHERAVIAQVKEQVAQIWHAHHTTCLLVSPEQRDHF